MIDVLSFLLAFLGGFVPAYTINHPVPVILPPSAVLSVASVHQLAGGSAGAGSPGSFFTVLVVPDSRSSFHYVEVIYGADKPASISANLSNLSTICAYIRFPKLPSGYKDEYPSIKLLGWGVTFITRLKERVLTVTPRGPAFVYRDVLVHASRIIFYNTSEIRLYPPSAFSWGIVPTKKKGEAWRLISFYAGNMTLYVFASGVGPVWYTGQLSFSKSVELQWIQLWDKANNFSSVIESQPLDDGGNSSGASDNSTNSTGNNNGTGPSNSSNSTNSSVSVEPDDPSYVLKQAVQEVERDSHRYDDASSFSNIYSTGPFHYKFPRLWFYHHTEKWSVSDGVTVKHRSIKEAYLPIVPLSQVAEYLNLTVPDYWKNNLTMMDLAVLANKSLTYIEDLVVNLTVRKYEALMGSSTNLRAEGLSYIDGHWLVKVSGSESVMVTLTVSEGKTIVGTLHPIARWTVVSAFPASGFILVNKHTGEAYIRVYPEGDLPTSQFGVITGTVVLYGGEAIVTTWKDGLPTGVFTKYIYRYKASVKFGSKALIKAHLKDLHLTSVLNQLGYKLYAQNDDWALYRFGLSKKEVRALQYEREAGASRLFWAYLEDSGLVWVFDPSLKKLSDDVKKRVWVNPASWVLSSNDLVDGAVSRKGVFFVYTDT